MQEPGKRRSFEEQATEAIKSLQKAHMEQLNRLLACEAMLVAMIRRMPPQALPGLSEEYSAAIDRMAAQLDPDLQRPEKWEEHSEALEALLKSHQEKDQRKSDQRPHAN